MSKITQAIIEEAIITMKIRKGLDLIIWNLSQTQDRRKAIRPIVT